MTPAEATDMVASIVGGAGALAYGSCALTALAVNTTRNAISRRTP